MTHELAAATRPTAARGRFPYPHRTMAEVMADEERAARIALGVTCKSCGADRSTACGYSRCPLRMDVAA